MDWVSISYEVDEPQEPLNISSRPLIITDTPFFHPDIPSLYRSSEEIPTSKYIRNFIGKYEPDRIYTVNITAGLENENYVSSGSAPGLFFPDAAGGVYTDGEPENLMLSSMISAYLKIPLVFSREDYPIAYDFTENSTGEILDHYTGLINDEEENIDCLVLVNPLSESSYFAGRYAGKKRCYPVLISTSSTNDIKNIIRDAAEGLSEKGFLFSAAEYRTGDIPSIAIFGGNASIPFIQVHDFGHEVFNDADGDRFYNDIAYGWFGNDTYPGFSVSRFAGPNEAVSLQVESSFIGKGNETVIYAEYKDLHLLDAMTFGGGMLQGFSTEMYLEASGIGTERIVEQRIDHIPNSTELKDMKKAVKKYYDYIGKGKLKSLIGYIGVLTKALEIMDVGFYSLFEYDWLGMVFSIPEKTEPEHLPVIDEDKVEDISDYDIAAYYGPGIREWVLPNHEMDYWAMTLYPYENPFKEKRSINAINYDGFLYNDHDISSESGITEEVLSYGGSLVVSSGVTHPVYSAYSSNAFFRSLSRGDTVGDAFYNSVLMNPESIFWSSQFMASVIDWQTPAPAGLLSPNLYAKAKLERLLLGDPDIRPYEGKGGITDKPEYFITPFFSFLSVQTIGTEYEINQSRLIINDTDTDLAVKEKPAIPVFVKDFYLPAGSAINYINFTPSYTLREGIRHEVLYNDSYYTDYGAIVASCASSLGLAIGDDITDQQRILMEECIYDSAAPDPDYPYPGRAFWSENHTLPDERIFVRVYVPAVIIRNGTYSDILENAEIAIDYDTDIEFFIHADDSTIYDENIVYATVMNEGEEEIEGTLEIVFNGTLTEVSVSIEPGGAQNEEINLGYLPGGYYEVKAAFASEDISIGPRHSSFTVYEEPLIRALPYQEEIVINEGESGSLQIILQKTAGITIEPVLIESTDLISNPLISSDNIEITAGDFGENASMTAEVRISVPDMQEQGVYEGSVIVRYKDNELLSLPLKVAVPRRSVPEIEPASWSFEGIPGYEETKFFTLINTGNTILDITSVTPLPVEMQTSLEPGESFGYGFNKIIPLTAPGIYEEDIYFAFEEDSIVSSLEIPVAMKVLPVVYWDADESWDIVLGEDPLERTFALMNDQNSNTVLDHMKIAFQGEDEIEITGNDIIPADSGENGSLGLSVIIPEGIEEGRKEGIITLTGRDYYIPVSKDVHLSLLAKGPDIEIERSQYPKTLYNLSDFIIPRSLRNMIQIRNVGKEEIKSIDIREDIPAGWVPNGVIKIFYARSFGKRIVPMIPLEIKVLGHFDRTVNTGIEDISKTKLGRYLRKDEYLIIMYSLRSAAPAPDTSYSSSIRAYTKNDVYEEHLNQENIKIKDIFGRRFFGFF